MRGGGKVTGKKGMRSGVTMHDGGGVVVAGDLWFSNSPAAVVEG